MTFLEKIVKNDGGEIRLLFAKEQNQDCWFYIKPTPELYSAYKNKLKTGNFNIKDYGEILFSGWGKNPPDDVVKKISEMNKNSKNS